MALARCGHCSKEDAKEESRYKRGRQDVEDGNRSSTQNAIL